MPRPGVEREPATATSISLQIVAAAIIIAALYYASSIVITLVCSIFIAFVLDPAVHVMERGRIPRWLGSLLVVMLGLAAVYLLVYTIYERVLDFLNDLPRFMATVQGLIARVEAWARSLRLHQPIVGPLPDAAIPTVRLQQESPWMQFLLRGIGSVYAFTVTVMFIPFLVFFMLTSKNHIWAATLNLFPLERRQQAEDVISGIGQMVRQYVLGNVLVALVSACLMTPVFVTLQLRDALVLGPLAAILSLIPYIGVALGVLPPLLVAFAQFERLGPYLAIAATVAAVHFLAVNVLTPKLVGRRVKLNALTVTLGMMFWGWLWGGIGLVLSVPITAALKAVCDNVMTLRPLGEWMGED